MPVNNYGMMRGFGQPRSNKKLPNDNPAYQDTVDDNPLQPQQHQSPPQQAGLGGAILGQPQQQQQQQTAVQPQKAEQPSFVVPQASGALSQALKQPAQQQAPSYNTRLMEGDAGKLANVQHAAKSPKYDFLQLAQQNKYNYNQLPQMLAELQGGANGKHWQGWEADRGDLIYKGDPNALGQEWGGVTSVDAVGGFGKDGSTASGWRWGVGDGAPQGPMAPGLGSALMPQAGMDGGGYMPFAEGTDYSALTLQQILAALGGGR